MIIILMMSAKLPTLGFLKLKLFSNKSYEVIIFVHDVNKKIITWLKLSCRCGYVTKVW